MIGIAFLFTPGTRQNTRAILDYYGPLEFHTHHKVHFGILSARNVVFAKEAVTKGELLVCNNAHFCKTFTMHTLSMYAALNTERKEILEKYAL